MRFLKLENPFVLAPMAGITDIAFRTQCRRHGAALVYSEMISANSLVHGNRQALEMLETNMQEKPVIAQLFGQQTDTIVEAARIIEKNYGFDAIDINMGCPATNIIKEGAGSALLNRKSKVTDIISRTSSAIGMPLTVKIRAGISFKDINAVEIAQIAERSGAAAIAVHGRVAIQGYGGKADWSHIKAVAEAVSIPVIGNGDVTTAELAQKMLHDTSCRYVMIGRASRGNPFIFDECMQYSREGKYKKHGPDDQKDAFFEYLNLAREFDVDFKRIKVHANYFTKGIVGGARIREKLAHTKTIEELRALF